MDISFDVINTKGDHILVALSTYDTTTLKALTEDSEALGLTFYDVSLRRLAGVGHVGYYVLTEIAGRLAAFLLANPTAVLCFYCDAASELDRHHKEMPPQEYRSQLFSRMFDMYVRKFQDEMKGEILVNYPVVAIDEHDRWKNQYAHFICRIAHLPIIKLMRETLLAK